MFLKGYNHARIEEAVLALLRVFESGNGRAWKRFDFGVMDVLHEKGYIADPKGRHAFVHLTEQGMELVKRIAGELFGLIDRHHPSGGDFG